MDIDGWPFRSCRLEPHCRYPLVAMFFLKCPRVRAIQGFHHSDARSSKIYSSFHAPANPPLGAPPTRQYHSVLEFPSWIVGRQLGALLHHYAMGPGDMNNFLEMTSLHSNIIILTYILHIEDVLFVQTRPLFSNGFNSFRVRKHTGLETIAL